MKSLSNLVINQKKYFDFIIHTAIVNALYIYLICSRYLFVIFSSGTLFATSKYAYTSLLGKLLVIVIILFSYIGHLGLLAFLPCLILLPLVFILPSVLLRLTATVFWALLAIYLLLDNVIYSLYAFHLNLNLFSIFFDKDYPVINFLELSNREIVTGVLIMGALFLLEILTGMVLWKLIIERKKILFNTGRFFIFIAISLLISYSFYLISLTHNNNILAQETPVLPLYNDILVKILPIKNSFDVVNNFSESRFAQPLKSYRALNYPIHPLHCRPENKKKNVVIIAIDSWRFDAMNAFLTPNIEKFAKHAMQFTHHYSGGNATQSGLFTLFYSLPDSYWQSMQKQKRSALMLDEFIKQGYQTRIFFSSDMIPPFDKTIFYNIPKLRTTRAQGETIADRDRAITEEFNDFIAKRNLNTPFFTFLFYDSAHGYYQKQNFNKVYNTQDSDLQRFFMVKNTATMQEIIKRYKNAVHFIDEEINKVLVTLKNRKLLDNTIIIITSDHGEEFNDNQKNFLGHGSNYTKYQIKTPFILWWPQQKPRIINWQTTHFDLVPTLMSDVLGCDNKINDYSLGKHLLNKQRKPYLLVSSYMNMALVEKNKITTLYTSGNVKVTDSFLKPLPASYINKNFLADAFQEMQFYYAHGK